MPNARRIRRRSREPRTWLSVVIALAFHGSVFAATDALGLTLIGRHARATAMKPLPPAPDEADLKPSCFNNAVLGTSGRAALCLAPWVASIDECLNDAGMSLWMSLSSCQAANDPGTAVAMIEPKVAARVKAIDPERLLDETKPETKPPSPPKSAQQPQMVVAPPPPPPPQPPQRQLPQQVVETVKPDEEKEPENARLLAEYNTKVDKQKVARGARNEPLVAKSKPEELTAKDKPRDDPSVQKHTPDRPPGRDAQAPDVPGKLSMRSPGALFPSQSEQERKIRGAMGGASGPLAADGYTARKGDGSIDQERRERSETPRGQSGAGGGVPDVPNLRPSEEVLERALGGGSVDHLEDVDNGDETSLSAKRWIYASFFNRLKRAVAQHWDPNSVWRRTDPTGAIFGNKTRVTEVRVSLSRSGTLARILVTSPSGSTELDEEAVRAFRSAAPFVNPPEGLVKDDLITFGFSFHFQLGAQHVSWRLPQAM